MNILALQCALDQLSVCVSKNSDHFESTQFCPKDSETVIFKMIDNLLKQADLKLKDINRFVVSHGPGSYTSLRVGIAIMKTFAMVNNIALIPIDTLSILASSCVGQVGLFKVVLNFNRTEIYHCDFQFNQNGKLLKKDGINLNVYEDVASKLNKVPTYFYHLKSNTRFIGKFNFKNPITPTIIEPKASLLLNLLDDLKENSEDKYHKFDPKLTPLYIKKDIV